MLSGHPRPSSTTVAFHTHSSAAYRARPLFEQSVDMRGAEDGSWIQSQCVRTRASPPASPFSHHCPPLPTYVLANGPDVYRAAQSADYQHIRIDLDVITSILPLLSALDVVVGGAVFQSRGERRGRPRVLGCLTAYVAGRTIRYLRRLTRPHACSRPAHADPLFQLPRRCLSLKTLRSDFMPQFGAPSMREEYIGIAAGWDKRIACEMGARRAADGRDSEGNGGDFHFQRG
ncbi:hypothetical protein DFH09DRAFT_484822 [Mycena vulgaris]|nr:hypothetical protein DFH09DRAFT_484822 [Mycena vulgaris]